MSKDSDGYKVGPGRLPKEHQWRKSHCPNPKGRPRKQNGPLGYFDCLAAGGRLGLGLLPCRDRKVGDEAHDDRSFCPVLPAMAQHRAE
jgi:hypothetical protein